MKFVLLLSALLATTTFGIKMSTSYDPVDARKCAKSGGQYKKGGLWGTYSCIKKYADAYKPCTSSEDCLGDCIVFDIDNPISNC